MTRYWVVAPYLYDSSEQEIFDSVWNFDLENNVISLGWNLLVDVTHLDAEELHTQMEKAFPSYPPGTVTKCANMLWSFIHEVKKGDIIIARKGRKRLAGIGTVTREAFFQEAFNKKALGKYGDDFHSTYVEVHWHDSPRDMEFDRIVFGMLTLYEISETQHKTLFGESEEVESLEDIEDKTSFVLEKYLEEFIIENFESIFHKDLEIFIDPEENVNGQQYATDIGIIDILAIEPSTSNLVVIELKKGRGVDSVVGQTLRYIGWVQENLCKEGQKVRGIIICHEMDAKLKYALLPVSNIEVKLYEIDFRLVDSAN